MVCLWSRKLVFAFRIRSVDKDTKNLSLCNRDSSNFYVNILKKINFQPPRNSHANLFIYLFIYFFKENKFIKKKRDSEKDLFTVWAEMRRQSITLFDFGWEICTGWLKFFAKLGISVDGRQSASSIDLGVTDKF